MKRLLLITLTFFIIVLLGCKKVGKGGVNGTVKEEGTGLPFPNVGVYIERTTKSGENSKLNPTIVANTITDANGHYETKFRMQFNYLYRIYCMPIDAGTYSAIASEPLPTKNENVDFKLPPFAYVKVIEHKASNIVTDWAYLQFDYKNSIDLNVPNYPFDATLGVYRVKGNDSVHIYWAQFYNTSTVWASGRKTVYINKGDTLYYDINFD